MGFAFASGINLTAADDQSIAVATLDLTGPVPSSSPVLIVPTLAIVVLDGDVTEVDALVRVSDVGVLHPTVEVPIALLVQPDTVIALPAYVLEVGHVTAFSVDLELSLPGASGPTTGVYGTLAAFWNDAP